MVGEPGATDSLTAARNLGRYASFCGASSVLLSDRLADRARRQALDGQAAETRLDQDEHTGDDDGHLVALEGRTGKHLWHFYMGEGLTASPITYEVNGKQYVAIASATAIFSFGLFEPAQP